MAATTSSATAPSNADTRSRILAATAELIASGGRPAATTRAVAAAASVQAPTIYRLFGDKDGLLDAVAEKALADYIEIKAQREQSDDPVDDLRRSWDSWVEFGLDHPEVFALMHATGRESPSATLVAGLAVLRDAVQRVARTGRLRVSEERAVDLVDAASSGCVLTLSRKPPEDREGLSDSAREAIFAALVGEEAQGAEAGAAGAASALRADLNDIAALTPGERQLLDELLQRIAEPA